MRRILAVRNDTHAGHKLGLLNPDTVLHAENEVGELVPYHPQLTATQEYLWEIYLRDMDRVFEIAGGDEVLLLDNGDIVQGKTFKDNLVSTRMSDQIAIAVANFDPWCNHPNLHQIRMSKGTEVHNFGEGSAELIVASVLTNRYPKITTTVTQHGLLTYNGAVIDYAHKGPPPGSRTWLKGNQARFYLRDAMLRDILAHRRPPDIFLRAHVHYPIHEVLEVGEFTSHLFVVPPYCLMDEYAVSATQSLEEVYNGMLVLEVIDGEVTAYEKLYHALDIRTEETIG